MAHGKIEIKKFFREIVSRLHFQTVLNLWISSVCVKHCCLLSFQQEWCLVLQDTSEECSLGANERYIFPDRVKVASCIGLYVGYVRLIENYFFLFFFWKIMVHWKKNGLETIFTQKLLINFTNIYKQMASNKLN